MAEVVLTIGGRRHAVTCRDGEEARLRQLGEMLERRWPDAARAGGGNSERAMLFVALMLADTLADAEQRSPVALDDAGALTRVADRLEALAATLEERGPSH